MTLTTFPAWKLPEKSAADGLGCAAWPIEAPAPRRFMNGVQGLARRLSLPILVAVAVLPAIAMAQPSDPAGGQVSDLLQQRANDAVALTARVQSGERWAIGAAVLAFVLTAGLIWLLSSRWVRASWAQWLALLVVPTLAAICMAVWSAGDIHGRLERLPRDALQQIQDDPTLGAEPGYVESARDALALKTVDDDDNLRRTLAQEPALITAALALVLLAGIWVASNRRVLKSA